MADQRATVNFAVVSSTCSSVIPVQLSIDGVLVATDTFRIAVRDPRTLSRTFIVAPGDHAMGARVENGFVWPTHTVSLRPDMVYTDSLPFYCS